MISDVWRGTIQEGNRHMEEDPNSLQLLGSETFRAPELYRVVTFLNRCLKRRGLIFGLSRVDDQYCIRIYQGRPDNPEEPARAAALPHEHS